MDWRDECIAELDDLACQDARRHLTEANTVERYDVARLSASGVHAGKRARRENEGRAVGKQGCHILLSAYGERLRSEQTRL